MAENYEKCIEFCPLRNICGGMGLGLERFSEFTRSVLHKYNQSSKITFLPTALILALSVGTQVWVVTSFLKTLNLQNN